MISFPEDWSLPSAVSLKLPWVGAREQAIPSPLREEERGGRATDLEVHSRLGAKIQGELQFGEKLSGSHPASTRGQSLIVQCERTSHLAQRNQVELNMNPGLYVAAVWLGHSH